MGLHASNSPQLIAIWILLTEELIAIRHHSGLGPESVLLLHLLLIFSLDYLLLLILVLLIGASYLILDLLESSLLPVLEIVLIMIKENSEVTTSELIDLLFVDGDKHRGHQL